MANITGCFPGENQRQCEIYIHWNHCVYLNGWIALSDVTSQCSKREFSIQLLLYQECILSIESKMITKNFKIFVINLYWS